MDDLNDMRDEFIATGYTIPSIPTGVADASDTETTQPVRAFFAAPNPFTSETRLHFRVGTRGGAAVDVAIYNVAGQRVKTIASGHRSAGAYNASWDGRDESGTPVQSGVYFYRASIDGRQNVARLVHMK